MAISPVATSAAASTAQANASVAIAQAKAANQQTLIDAQSNNDSSDPLPQPPQAPTVNTSGQTIGTNINVTA